jgi:type VI secretion system secreted protein VgrG
MQAKSILRADKARFSFSAPGGNFAVYGFQGKETFNKPYEFEIELISDTANLNLNELLGAEAVLAAADQSGGIRYVHGLIRRMEQCNTAIRYTHYKCLLVPRLWFLSKISDNRIFQHMSVPEIITKLLQEQGFTPESFALILSYNYEEREYCVQYGESDLHFITRLCEEEGIYFYFEHTDRSHRLCFCDLAGGPKITGESSLRYYPGSGTRPDTAVVHKLNAYHTINSTASTYAEWNFEQAKLDLRVHDFEHEHEKAPRPRGMSLEQYHFPHLYGLRKNGGRYVQLQLLRQLTFRKRIECETKVSRFLPGYTFSVHSHPRDEVNADWLATSVEHFGRQPEVLEHEAPLERGLEYSSRVTAIPATTRYVPASEHAKNRIEGLQSAVVTGPAGEEIHCDEYGRVKVQFHWDRLGKHDEHTTCMVRVSDRWSGNQFGCIRIPRIGQEVLVEFMEGDPDRPVITGRAYNKLKMPPWRLPEQKVLSGFQSRELKAGRRNQLVLDDTREQIQAQLSGEHDLSQLNLGYITRVNNVQGRKDFRGEGFELRTDGWGVVRAAEGLYISTNERALAEKHVKDASEATKQLQNAVKRHKENVERAVEQEAQEAEADGDAVASRMNVQAGNIRGDGEAHNEFTEPQLLLSGAAGIAATTSGTLHVHTQENTGITTGRHTSAGVGKSFFAAALEKVRIFADRHGMRIFAGRGKVEIQAQSDALDMIAEKVINIISAGASIRLSAPKEIFFTAGGSFLRINEQGIEKGTEGVWAVKSASQEISGPAEMDWLTPEWEKANLDPEAKVTVWDEVGRPVNIGATAKKGYDASTATPEGEEVLLFREEAERGRVADVKLTGRKHLVLDGNAIPVKEEYDADGE